MHHGPIARFPGLAPLFLNNRSVHLGIAEIEGAEAPAATMQTHPIFVAYLNFCALYLHAGLHPLWPFLGMTN